MTTHPFAGHAALITGASAGIGAALAVELARQGADVVLFARRADRLASVAVEVEATGRRAVVVVGDVRVRSDVDAAVAAALAAFGRLDVVVANAGYGVAGRVDALTVDDFRRQYETNVFGVLHTIHAALPALTVGRGRLGIVGSVAGYIGAAGAAPYCSSKAAVRAIAESLRAELAASGVSVTHIVPGYVTSELRLKDNSERLDPAAPDSAPPWLVVPADAAARDITRALRRRRAEVIITWQARVGVAVARFAPRVARWVAGRMVRG
ncbi:MAG: SDR family NAD(P)-dependent oxidoreductase [Ardenticatenales bacterium]